MKLMISSSSMERTAKAYQTVMDQKAIETQVSILDARVVKGEISDQDFKAEKQKLTTPSHRPQKWRVNLGVIFGGLLVMSLILAGIRSIPEQGGMTWLFYIPALPKPIGDLSLFLAPLLAISVAIERLLETIFDTYEQSIRAAADVLAAPADTLDWIGREYQEAYEAAKKAADTVGVDAAPASMDLLAAAEQRLAKAEERLRSWTGSPEYVAWKRALSIWVGLSVGLVVSILGDLGMMHTIGIPIPRLLDMMVTGLVIGAGPGPMHSLIGILQNGKDALGNLSDLARSKSIKNAMDTLDSTTGKS